MRMLAFVHLPVDTFNEAVRDGTAGEKIQRILAETRPEAVYFTEMEGHRTALLALDVEHVSRIPALAEPWFLTFDAEVEFRIAMDPDDLARAGLDELGERWG